MKVVEGSKAWKREHEAMRERANQARTEKAKAQHQVSNPRVGEKVSGGASREAPPEQRSDDGKTATAIAKQIGVSRATIERVQRLKGENPAAFEALARGEKPLRKKQQPRIDREQRAGSRGRG